MNKQVLYLALVSLLIALRTSVAQVPTTDERSTRGYAATVISADEFKWQQVRPGQESVALWGDRSSGPYGALNKFAAGFEDRRHFHSRDLRGLIVSGTMIVQVADGPIREIGSGSYLFLPGRTPHTHSCKAGAACVIFVQQDGPGDSVAVEAGK